MLVLSSLLFVWSGLILGVSFISTPVKFKAAHLSLAVALEVGKVTFHLFKYIEWAFFCVCILISLFVGLSFEYWLFFGVFFCLLFTESFYLLPWLDIRTEKIINGQSVERSILHKLFIISHLVKVILLLILASWILVRVWV